MFNYARPVPTTRWSYILYRGAGTRSNATIKTTFVGVAGGTVVGCVIACDWLRIAPRGRVTVLLTITCYMQDLVATIIVPRLTSGILHASGLGIHGGVHDQYAVDSYYSYSGIFKHKFNGTGRNYQLAFGSSPNRAGANF